MKSNVKSRKFVGSWLVSVVNLRPRSSNIRQLDDLGLKIIGGINVAVLFTCVDGSYVFTF